MNKYRVMVVKYGWTEIEAETEDDAVTEAKSMGDEDFDWGDFDDAQVVEEIDY